MTDERVIVRGVELAYRVSERTNVPDPGWFIWGHGLTSSMAGEDELGLFDWATLAEEVSLIRYDARGHGGSGSTVDMAGYHWGELAHDQLALADHLGVRTYVAGGASMGCATALYAALTAPERITALVLVIPPTAWDTRAGQQDTYELSAQLVEAGEFDLLVAGAADRPPPDPFVGDQAWHDRFERVVRTTPPERLARVLRGARSTDLPPVESLSTIDVPSLVLAWSGDAGHPVSTAERLAEVIPDARLEIASTRADLDRWTDLALELIRSVDLPRG